MSASGDVVFTDMDTGVTSGNGETPIPHGEKGVARISSVIWNGSVMTMKLVPSDPVAFNRRLELEHGKYRATKAIPVSREKIEEVEKKLQQTEKDVFTIGAELTEANGKIETAIRSDKDAGELVRLERAKDAVADRLSVTLRRRDVYRAMLEEEKKAYDLAKEEASKKAEAIRLGECQRMYDELNRTLAVKLEKELPEAKSILDGLRWVN